MDLDGAALRCPDGTKCLKWGEHCYAGRISLPEGVQATMYHTLSTCNDEKKVITGPVTLHSFWEYGNRMCAFKFSLLQGYSCRTGVVARGCTNPDTEHGEPQKRVMYRSDSPIGSEPCWKQSQVRYCNHGTWSAWAKPAHHSFYQYSSCTVGCSNPNAKHGGTETRIRYQSESVSGSEACVSQNQMRMCDSGSWSAWQKPSTDSEIFQFSSCTAGCSNPDTKHGATENRVTGSVTGSEVCVSQKQTRMCDSGMWSAWQKPSTENGTYQYSSCMIGCSNPDAKVGEEDSRLMYQSPDVTEPESCLSQVQTRFCGEGGKWSVWEGDPAYKYDSCSTSTLTISTTGGMSFVTDSAPDRSSAAKALFMLGVLVWSRLR